MSEIGLYVHEFRPEAMSNSIELSERLEEKGHKVRQSNDFTDNPSGFVDDLDLLVSMGGDGSILRAVNLLDGRPTPVLGINFGQLGYLTAAEPLEAFDAVARTLEGNHDLEERMMLKVAVEKERFESSIEDHALNEVVVERTAVSQTVRMNVSMDGSFFTSYAADGLIISTPTGSTAYAFSARGPIVDTSHQSIQITPVSPHMLFDRTLVLAPSTEIELQVTGSRTATCTVDGREMGVLEEKDRVVCTKSDRIAKLVTFGKRDFLNPLKTKFGLEDR
ncbi:MAG: NAD(+)/NADH kinase [Acidimicrobiales bacterium]|jgi:NAD+ kinase|nr:NAD(+) kinase [Actinomycetota bacterium]HAQ04420.1 NAD(+) kinase [Acidimicrobiaceae bacterium]|tara:strand:- start:146 stop:976 length:831 start_codon:yes stop_codon:yes gene_type:complete